jgi:hypothetical protein
MRGVRVLRWVLGVLAVALALALAALVAMIVPSADNGPYMTPFALLVVALATTLVLLGYVTGLRDDRPPTAGESPE